MRRNEVQGIAVPAVDTAKLASQMRMAFSSMAVEHRLKIAGRAADNLEHLRRRRLLL